MDEIIQELVSPQTCLQKPEVIRRNVRGKRCGWWIRAGLPPDATADAFPLVVTTENDVALECWVLPPTSKPPKREAKALPARGSFRPYREPFEIVEIPAAMPPSTESQKRSEAAGPAADTKPEPNGKKAKSTLQMRKAPPEFELRAQPADGACFFRCIATALSDPPVKNLSAAQLRAETIAHMRKYAESYQELWDGVDDIGQATPSFSDYLQRMAKADAWAGGLEVLALARHTRTALIILPQQSDLSPMAINNKWGLPRIFLWYTGKHYDLLLLREGQGICEGLANLSGEATQNIPRGGGPRSIASSAPTDLKIGRVPTCVAFFDWWLS